MSWDYHFFQRKIGVILHLFQRISCDICTFYNACGFNDASNSRLAWGYGELVHSR